jgi:mannosyltransferase
MNLSVFIHKHKYKIASSLFLFYLCFTFYKLGENSLWYDECFSIDLGNDTIEEIIHYSLYNDTNPPLYLIIVHYWIDFFGNSEFSLRSISAISGSITLAVFFLFSLRFFNWQTAVFAVLFFITSNELYYYSQEGRTYGLILLLCTLSNYVFMSLIQKPNWIYAILLGLINIAIFYMHTLGCINIVGQILLAPILAFNKQVFITKDKTIKSFLGYKLKFIIWYLASWFLFYVLFYPWQERFFGIIEEGGKGFWLKKPTFVEYKQVLFDFYNSEYLFYVYGALILMATIVVLFFKKYREDSFNYKLLIVPLILGPLLYNFDYFAATISPIFLKRYILFTLLGFILLFAYLLSSLKINFKIKLSLVLVMCILSFSSMKYPRAVYWDYKNVVASLKEKISPSTFIYTDNAMLFAYYLDNEGAFKAYEQERYTLLAKHNVYTSGGPEWTKTFELSKYKDIYYTRSFSTYIDPEKTAEKNLNAEFTFVEELSFPGIQVSHYKNKSMSAETLKKLKEKILATKEWYDQVIIKAKERNVSIDSMMTLDAIWVYKNQK